MVQWKLGILVQFLQQISKINFCRSININKINVNQIESNREFLVENEKYETLFFKFEPTKGIPNHIHNGYASIQVLDGIVDMKFTDGEEFELNKGDFLPFDARKEHNVIARVTSKVLVTIIK